MENVNTLGSLKNIIYKISEMTVSCVTDPFNCSSVDFSFCSKLVCSLDCSSYDAGRTNNRKFKSVAFPLLVIVLVSIKFITPNDDLMAKSLIDVNFFGQTSSSSIVYSYFPARPLCRRRNALIQWFSVSQPLGHTSSFQIDPRLSTISLEKIRCGPFFGTNLRKVKCPTVYFGLRTSSGFTSLEIVLCSNGSNKITQNQSATYCSGWASAPSEIRSSVGPRSSNFSKHCNLISFAGWRSFRQWGQHAGLPISSSCGLVSHCRTHP